MVAAPMPRRTRLRSLVGLSIQRTLGQFRHGNRKRLVLSVTGVAIAIGLMVVVTSTSLGLATETTIYGSNVDYWIVPKGGTVSTMAVAVDGPQFGAAHETTDQIAEFDGVEHVTPVSMRVIRMQVQSSGDSEYLLVIGALGQDGVSIAGLPTRNLTPGDPFYADGSYDGRWTGDLIASPAALTVLNASPSDTLIPSGQTTNRSFNIREVSSSGVDTGAGALPVVLVHLSELQALEQTPPRDTADQFIVKTSTPAVRDSLASVYPSSRVVERSGLSASTVVSSDLSLAIALTAFIVALVLGSLFVATSLALEITADRHQLATLTAIGYSAQSLTILVATQTLTVSVLGGLLGLGLALPGIVALNTLATSELGTGSIAILHPGLAVYGLVVALLIGLVCAPYLAWLAARTTTVEDLSV